MNRTHEDVVSRWLESRSITQRTGSEGEKFSDECWQTGPRLSARPRSHYDLVMSLIRWTITD